MQPSDQHSDQSPAHTPPGGLHPWAERRRWMAVLARATAQDIADRLPRDRPGYGFLRRPESGLVMVRGRAGGGGAPFNLGEMTVTRCTIRTDTGLVGHAYVTGRDERQAELAALVDALMQDPDRRGALDATLVTPLESAQGLARTGRAEKAAATRVQFFAMQTMRT
jgi:alpha-D-ribose 1-methylphosphonate 5-triphosphate synthase subunit PhnG